MHCIESSAHAKARRCGRVAASAKGKIASRAVHGHEHGRVLEFVWHVPLEHRDFGPAATVTRKEQRVQEMERQVRTPERPTGVRQMLGLAAAAERRGKGPTTRGRKIAVLPIIERTQGGFWGCHPAVAKPHRKQWGRAGIEEKAACSPGWGLERQRAVQGSAGRVLGVPSGSCETPQKAMGES